MFQEHHRDAAAVVLVEQAEVVARLCRVALAAAVALMDEEDLVIRLVLIVALRRGNRVILVVQEIQGIAVVLVIMRQVARQEERDSALQGAQQVVAVVVLAVLAARGQHQLAVVAREVMLVMMGALVAVERVAVRVVQETMDHLGVMVRMILQLR